MKKITISLVALIFATTIISVSAYAQQTGTFTDNRDGYVYKTVKIGTQTWLAENIVYKTSSGSWAYDNNESYIATYGRLYNWETAKNACPSGWHLPSDEEWIKLTDFLGGGNVAGGKLKETDTTHWISPNAGATNESNFTALPGGTRYINGTFGNIGGNGYWWSSTEDIASNAWDRGVGYSSAYIGRDYDNKKYGFSVRCVRD